MNTRSFQKTRYKQHGVVLIVALMLLAIMSIVGILTVRNSNTTEQVTNNFRLASVAQQAAELALKYCEGVATDLSPTSFVADKAKIYPTTLTAVVTSGAWNTSSTWTNSANFISVSNSFSLSNNADVVQFKNRPQCLIEKMDNINGKGFLITARGFGNDAVLNANNGVISGSEAWVQSLLVQ